MWNVGDFTLYWAEGQPLSFADPSGDAADVGGDFDALLRRHRRELPILLVGLPEAQAKGGYELPFTEPPRGGREGVT